ncbi:MAG TPA: Uma2 family endonuclease [Thermoanaerobaculia bacterium]|jgi:Uma2 family endonuclease|nr:Uma2 family endonuclease [Thermoanaerobaculia bacterium]
MAEPSRTRSTAEPIGPRSRVKRDNWRCTLLRYVEMPDGSLEIQEMPLTPEEFLDPQIGDTMVQGRHHIDAVLFLFEMLKRWFRSRKDVAVLSDLKHLMGPRRGPAPDISILMGVPDLAPDIESYDLRTGGIPPSLIIEVVSPSDTRIRRTDEVTKVELYQQIGVREYLLLDLPRPGNRRRMNWRGYRLDQKGRYIPIEPDLRGRIHSETTNLLFGTDPNEMWMEILDARTGERLLTPAEEEEGRKREAKARQQAEAEVARLRKELARLRGES